ncbi:MAG: N-acetylmuramoyl-L-alanine amidase, partial [Bacteroidota bacterium]
YNGNISGMLWENPTSCTKKGYAYQYDGLNRLTQATYGEKATTQSNWSQHAGRYNASYTYDLNGNILSLSREGKITNGYGSMDVLTYTYSGNQLTSVSDAGDNSFQTMHQFLDGNISGTDYQYDGSGNMIDDMNKGIDVMYNHLNKPTSVQKGTQIIQYIYSADGIKLRQKVTTSEPLPGQSAVSKITDYVNGYEYEDPDGGGNASSKELVHIMHAKGRMVYDATNDSYTYEYFLKDHLGNTRVVFADNNQDGRINPDPLNGTDIRQIVEGYYPFGAQHNTDQSVVISPENQYLYNGKELQDELNLGWYDYGARMYDPVSSRFPTVDPLAESFANITTFQYASNNPVTNIDLDGLEGINFQTGEAQVVPAIPNRTPNVGIDPGHGDQHNQNRQIDPGAVNPEQGLNENDLALGIAQSTSNRLSEVGIDITMTRDDNVEVDGNRLEWRIEATENSIMFVSIHINAASNENARGFEVHFLNEDSQVLAESIAESQETVPLRGDGTRQSSFYVLRAFENGPSVLVEAGFITNEEDRNLLHNKAGQIGTVPCSIR